MSNPYWENITKIAEKQREKGIKEYGQGLEDNTDPNFMERINYIEEELVDALMYLEWLKDAKAVKAKETVYQSKAMAFYSAYLVELQRIGAKLEEEQENLPLILGMQAKADIVQTISLQAGFDPIEVLDNMTKKLKEGDTHESN